MCSIQLVRDRAGSGLLFDHQPNRESPGQRPCTEKDLTSYHPISDSFLSVKEFPALQEEIDRSGVFFLVVGHVADGGAGHHHPRRTFPFVRARYAPQPERIRHPGTDLDGLRIFSP